MSNTNTFFLFLFLLLGLVSCNKTTKNVTTTASEKPIIELETPTIEKGRIHYELFDTFSEKFHADSLFQLERLKFPIQGYAVNQEGNESHWSKSNWLMHRFPIQMLDTSVYKVKITERKGERIEEIFIEGSGFRTERVFKQIKGKWYLTSFIDEQL